MTADADIVLNTAGEIRHTFRRGSGFWMPSAARDQGDTAFGTHDRCGEGTR
ncbi:hypothetical protein [Amycolatopsis sp. cmx-4-61]|uniref:hypothetical protein n=1 Tax=Amycolatopsis sp. cmx-4-61 TaxID=2790937 RepID=UPI00397DE125